MSAHGMGIFRASDAMQDAATAALFNLEGK
jgi:hypothetical protein